MKRLEPSLLLSDALKGSPLIVALKPEGISKTEVLQRREFLKLFFYVEYDAPLFHI